MSRDDRRVVTFEDYQAELSELAYYEREPEPYDDPYYALRPWLKRYVGGSEPAGGGYFDHTGGD